MSEPTTDVDESTTQKVVPDLIKALHRANMELVQPSNAPAFYQENDPHLRLRRTLTPSSPITGLKKYNEAQFMIQGSSGKRVKLEFAALGHEFQMDAYVWGASEQSATTRVVALHGISPGASRTRWHSLGERLSTQSKSTRFIALDWHSIDRTDIPQDEFLTLLPKHIFSVPQNDTEIVEMFPPEKHAWCHDWFQQVRENCPRSLEEGAEILAAVIEQGLGWGNDDTPFYLCIKSWSGGVGVSMLASASESFRKHVAGAIVMHPAYFLEEENCAKAVENIPTIMCWAKDDAMVPFELSSRYLVHDNVKLIAYEEGGHSNLPAFDDEILMWLDEQG